MKQFKVLFRPTDNAWCIISHKSIHFPETLAAGYKEVFSGNKSECIEYLENWWEENNIPEDHRMHMSLN